MSLVHVLILPTEHFVTERRPAGGIFQLDQARALSNAGHQVGVLSVGVISPRFLFRSYRYREHESIEGIRVFRRYRRKYTLQRWATPELMTKALSELFDPLYQDYERQHGRPDVVHAHNVFYAAFMAHRLQQTRQIPYVVTEHSSAYAERGITPAMQSAGAEPVRAAKAITAVGSRVAQLVGNVLKRDVQVLANVLGQEFLSDPECTRATGAGKTVLNVAALEPVKDHETLLRAFASKFKKTSTRLRIAGSGPQRKMLQELAVALEISDQVTFLGHVDRMTVRHELSRCDCFVLSSRTETFGVAVIEALACGIPVVSTRCGGPEDLIHDGNGVLTPIGDASALAEGIASILNGSSHYSRRAIREDCLDRFGPKAFAARAASLYALAMESTCG